VRTHLLLELRTEDASGIEVGEIEYGHAETVAYGYGVGADAILTEREHKAIANAKITEDEPIFRRVEFCRGGAAARAITTSFQFRNARFQLRARRALRARRRRRLRGRASR